MPADDSKISLHYCIVGTKHCLQVASTFPFLVDEEDIRLRDGLAEIIKRQDVVLIAEEVDANALDQLSLHGRNLARDHDPPIPWLSIDMTILQMQEAGIWDDLISQSDLNEQAEIRGESKIHHRVHANDVRETYWLKQIKVCCETHDIVRGMVIIVCGIAHLGSLAEKAKLIVSRVDTMQVPEDLITELGEIISLP
jgi:hypothetical protein